MKLVKVPFSADAVLKFFMSHKIHRMSLFHFAMSYFEIYWISMLLLTCLHALSKAMKFARDDNQEYIFTPRFIKFIEKSPRQA